MHHNIHTKMSQVTRIVQTAYSAYLTNWLKALPRFPLVSVPLPCNLRENSKRGNNLLLLFEFTAKRGIMNCGSPTDDFDPIGIMAEKVVELWEVRPL